MCDGKDCDRVAARRLIQRVAEDFEIQREIVVVGIGRSGRLLQKSCLRWRSTWRSTAGEILGCWIPRRGGRRNP